MKVHKYLRGWFEDRAESQIPMHAIYASADI